MAQLEKFRIGWENEHLATFLLSRISFVANPIKVADDIGTDLFCTLFEVVSGALLPRSSLAIQVKSSKDTIDASGKIEYFQKLELPFFVGVADQSNLKLSIYSGEFLPIFFPHHGIPQNLRLSLENSKVTYENYWTEKEPRQFTLKMPHVMDLDAREERDSIATKATILTKLCSRILQNISSGISKEYVFKLGDERVAIFAGPGSAETFRENFYYRLAEAFYNFQWLYLNRPTQFNFAEFQLYENYYNQLKAVGEVPATLESSYKSVKQHLTGI